MDGGHVVMLPIEDVMVLDPSPPSDRPHVRVAGRPVWFRSSPPLPVPSSPLQAVLYTASREPADVDETFASAPVPILNPVADWTSAAAPDEVRLDLQIEIENAPEPGALMSVDAGSDQLWIAVRDVGVLAENASGADRVRVSGSGLWWRRTPPDTSEAPDASLRVNRAHRLALELWVRPGGDETRALVLRELGLAPDHPRYWATLRHDNARYGDESSTGRERALASERFFPLAGAGAADALYLPIDVALTPDAFLGAARQPGTALERDGLARFSPALFLDPDLITPLTERVQNEAEHVRYTAESPRRLKGMHATLEIEEATIIAVPDAVHPGWTRVTADTTAPPQPSPPNPQPAWGTFLSCGTAILARPQWAARLQEPAPLRFDSGTFTLEWEPAGSAFVVEESHQRDWFDATVIYSGADTRVPIYGRPHGTYYYRVRATDGRQTSDWSDGLVVVVAGAQAWQLADDRSYSPETLVAVHRGLLRMSAARGDLFALLTLPEHYRANDTLAHVSLLKSGDAPAIPVDVDRPSMPISLPLGAAEARVFSYGALYHPWLILREQTSAAPLVRVPPDGSMAGLFAQRARRRGAWIAPANEALGGVVAVSPAIARGERFSFLDALVNVIRQEPRGFLPVSANTLSDDPDLASINVRRLLSLLRRLALREGTTYVFEPHDDSFRRLVQRGFEGLLTHMFERGAFAGRTTASAFQVSTSTSLNTPQSTDAGRFIVELRVAPSQPMSFLTVRLVQSGDRTLVMEDR
jgi:hypothetical protein